MKVGVTGGSGFIGGWVWRELKQRGHDVLIMDHHTRQWGTSVREDTFYGDVTDDVAVTEFAAHVDGIIHLAAVLGTQETISNPRPSAHTNILGTLNVLEAADQYKLPVVVAGVGNQHFRNHGATGSYTISKAAAEDYCRMFATYRGTRVAIVRPVNAYGPGQSASGKFGPSKVRKILPALICRALTGAPLEIYGDGSQISDCVYVEDVAQAFVSALEHEAQEHIPGVIEVGPSTSCSINDIATMVARYVAQSTGETQVPIEHVPMRPGELTGLPVTADTSTLAQIGMSAERFVPLELGISRTVDWFREAWLPGYLKQGSTQ